MYDRDPAPCSLREGRVPPTSLYLASGETIDPCAAMPACTPLPACHLCCRKASNRNVLFDSAPDRRLDDGLMRSCLQCPPPQALPLDHLSGMLDSSPGLVLPALDKCLTADCRARAAGSQVTALRRWCSGGGQIH